MKMLLILWALGLAGCDKLDRTYLPPSGSVAAGGYSDILNLPLGSYSSTLKTANYVLAPDGSLRSKLPNTALGIDRQGLSVTESPRFSVSGPGALVSNIYNPPITTNSYDLTQTSTLPPIQTYDSSVGPTTTLSEKYFSTSSPIDPNVTYEQYLSQQILKPNKSSQPIPNLVSSDSVLKPPKENIAQTFINFQSDSSDSPAENNQQVSNPSIKNPFLDSNVNEYLSGQLDKTGAPESQFKNIHSMLPNLTPHSLSKTKYPRIQYESDLINTSDESNPTTNQAYPDKFHNQQTFPSYSSHQGPKISSGITSSTKTAMPSSTYSSTPSFPNENFETFYSTTPQTQRMQAVADKNADILNYENKLTPDGFAYSFDTSNGIHVDESGTANDGVKAKGSYSFIGDDGKLYSIEYTADENGYLPRGDHLPTAPPIPNAILKGIEQAERNKKLGIFDDGSYNAAKYGHDRYQGLKNRKPQNYIYDVVVNQPVLKENKQQSERASFKNIDLPADNSQILNTAKLGATLMTPNKSNIDLKNKDSYKVLDDKQPNKDSLVSFDSKNIKNKFIVNPRNKFQGDFIKGATGLNNNLDQNTLRNLGIDSPKDDVQKEYNDNDINQRFHSGYEYIQPQNLFDDSNTNNFQTQFPSDPITASGDVNNIDLQNRSMKLNIPTFYNRESGQIGDGENIVTERTFGTLDPKYGSTTPNPYDYQSSYATNGNDKQYTNYPSSTLGLEYVTSSTPVPSKTSPPFNTSTSFSYSQTTPTVPLITSTTKPSITSERLSSRPSGYTDRISVLEQMEDSGISTMKPSNRRIMGRPGYQVGSKRPKVPVTRTEFFEDFKPGFGVSTDPRSEKLNDSFRPENYNSQSIEKEIGEDFNGPKQPQRFDPVYGYYY